MAFVLSQKSVLLCIAAIAALILLAELISLSSKKQLNFIKCWTMEAEDGDKVGCETSQEQNSSGSEGCETHRVQNCSELEGSTETPLPMIFMITPTHSRSSQVPDIVRLCQTLMHVKYFHWIVVEDGDKLSQDVSDVLSWCSVSSVYLNYKTPPNDKVNRGRGADQRNLGLQWLRNRYKIGQQPGVVYFGDDDNTYHLQLFEEMRYTSRVSIWPVGLAGGLKAESPICKNGKVVDFHSIFRRKFSVDMAGFAVNLDLIIRKNVNFTSQVGYLETDFLDALVEVKDLEPKADCKKVYVWHTKTQSPTVKD